MVSLSYRPAWPRIYLFATTREPPGKLALAAENVTFAREMRGHGKIQGQPAIPSLHFRWSWLCKDGEHRSSLFLYSTSGHGDRVAAEQCVEQVLVAAGTSLAFQFLLFASCLYDQAPGLPGTLAWERLSRLWRSPDPQTARLIRETWHTATREGQAIVLLTGMWWEHLAAARERYYRALASGDPMAVIAALAFQYGLDAGPGQPVPRILPGGEE